MSILSVIPVFSKKVPWLLSSRHFEGFGSLCDKRCLMMTSPPCIFISVQRKTCPAKQHWSPLTQGTHKPHTQSEFRTGGKAINVLFVVCTFMLFWTGSTKRLFSPVLYCTIRTGALLQLAPPTRKLNVKDGPQLATMVICAEFRGQTSLRTFYFFNLWTRL